MDWPFGDISYKFFPNFLILKRLLSFSTPFKTVKKCIISDMVSEGKKCLTFLFSFLELQFVMVKNKVFIFSLEIS